MSSNWRAWVILLLAVAFEVVGTSCLKASQSLSRLGFTITAFVCYIFAIVGLALALKSIDVSIAYAVWAGLGIVCITVVGAVAFDEAMTGPRLVFIALILIGVVGLNILQT